MYGLYQESKEIKHSIKPHHTQSLKNTPFIVTVAFYNRYTYFMSFSSFVSSFIYLHIILGNA